MGYLGLDQTEVKEDNIFQRMFWPSDHAGETDALGKQGFWVCFGIAIISLVTLLVQGHWLIAPLPLLFYGLGGIGVREHSQPAAVLVAIVYLLEQLLGIVFLGRPPGLIAIAATVLLLANIRGTWIAARWAASGDPDAMPERQSTTFTDKLADQMPAAVWPRARIAFFGIAGVYVLLTLLSAAFLTVGTAGKTHAAQQDQPRSTVVEVSPSR
jgi:hypothetical protein